MAKFRLLAEHLRAQGLMDHDNCYEPGPLSLKTLMQAHDPEYVQRFIRGQLTQAEEKDIGLPWSEWLVERTLRAVSGTLLTTELALEHGLACHLAGGTHHAFPGRGSGFCIFNDLAVAARSLVDTGKASKVLIIDCDVHQGDGTIAFFEQDPNVIPVSFHCDDNYPMVKQSGGVNISVNKGCNDADYLALLQAHLPCLLQQYQPDFVLYDAGADVHKDDRLGHVQLTDEGIFARDRYVIDLVMSAAVPIACVIGGGYDHDHHKIAARHGLLHLAASQVWQTHNAK
ncbi:histone deacetylase family protein [Marinomonas fungiae]|uniref:Acetoin utilization deacetylase AcuC or a related deacetylase n=1 Tax=Marinomonas fungiae TaxID=1137284 RepID=A0A0K6IH34_9GAMM|nr:histone deacetylase [Marinomonas fungiae]CUB02434.1 Acetoin utilization deacetylase AcuC or a related deacetylase [Marinomonas fungiae]